MQLGNLRWDKKYLYWGITALLVKRSQHMPLFLMFRGANFKDGVSKIIAISMPIIDGLIPCLSAHSGSEFY